jgi:uncharacterized membrane protein YraQ (UPF0718 family)
MKKSLFIGLLLVSFAGIIFSVQYEANAQNHKKFIIKKEKTISLIKNEIVKRNKLNKKIEKLAELMGEGTEYTSNINSNLILILEAVEKTNNLKELEKIANTLD